MADTLLRSFRFQILLSLSAPGGGAALADGAFQVGTGLEIDMDIQEYYEGGSNDAVVRRVGRAEDQNIILKRGKMYGDSGSVNPNRWNWLPGVASGVRPV